MKHATLLRNLAWILLVAIAWPIVHELSLVVGLDLTEWIPSGPFMVETGYWPQWSTIAGYAFAGVGAFLLVFVVRRYLRATGSSWFGVLLIEAPDLIFFAIALVGLAFKLRLFWFATKLIAKSDAGPLPPADQLFEFFGWWAWDKVFPILGAWLGSRWAVRCTPATLSVPSHVSSEA